MGEIVSDRAQHWSFPSPLQLPQTFIFALLEKRGKNQPSKNTRVKRPSDSCWKILTSTRGRASVRLVLSDSVLLLTGDNCSEGPKSEALSWGAE